MTLEELKQNEPGLYNRVFEMGKAEGKRIAFEETKKKIDIWLDFGANPEIAADLIGGENTIEWYEAAKQDAKELLKQL